MDFNTEFRVAGEVGLKRYKAAVEASAGLDGKIAAAERELGVKQEIARKLKEKIAKQKREIARLRAIEGKMRSAPPTIRAIQKRIARQFGITVEELVSPQRNRHLVLPRHFAMYLACKHTNCSLPVIGRHFGGRDHTTVIHARLEHERRAREILELWPKKRTDEISKTLRLPEHFVYNVIAQEKRA